MSVDPWQIGVGLASVGGTALGWCGIKLLERKAEA